MVLDVLRLLAKGSDAAKEAGKKLLSGMPLALWRRGFDDSPAQALPVSCRGCAPTIGVAACFSIYSNRLCPGFGRRSLRSRNRRNHPRFLNAGHLRRGGPGA
jgi:hypothetical protein